MNKIQIIGRLCFDPELKSTPNGKAVCEMRLAADRRDRNAAPVYVDVKAWEKLAESCGLHLSKGRQVAVSGRLDYREWTTDAGERRSKHEIVADEVTFLGAKAQAEPAQPAEPAAEAEAEAEEAIPF